MTLSTSTLCAEDSTKDLNQRSILHLGCGRKYNPNAVNVDRVSDVGPDFVVNLDQCPWPFPDNRFREVWAYDVLEHLDDLVAVMEEIHRICQPEAVLRITVPHFSCSNAFADITHRHYFSVSSFNYFTGDNEFDFYSNCRFRRQKASIVFYPTLMNKLVHRIANRWPVSYERRWAWIFPAWFLNFELMVVKGKS